MRFLLAVDESDNSHRAVQYAGSLLRLTPEIDITLFHVLKPMPRQLLEHGGAEDPAAEERLGSELRSDQKVWLRTQREAQCPVLKKACEILVQCGFDQKRVTMKFGHEDNIAGNILEEARNGGHETIVVGRRGMSNMKRIFGGGVSDQLLRDAKGLTIWVVE